MKNLRKDINKNDSEEVWKPIRGYESEYAISNFGRIKSLSFRNNQTTIQREKILNPTDNGNGYLIFSLKKNGKRKNVYIHRLVAEAFIPKVKGKEHVNHKDYNRKNNSVFNLEWCNAKDNTRYSIPNMRKPKKTIRTNTGEKYIHFRNGRYRVAIKKKADRTFQTIEEAISFRNEVLNGICISK